MNTTVCNGDAVNITCGFSNADPSLAFPTWRIVRRSDDGSVINNRSFSGNDIFLNMFDGLRWIPDIATEGMNGFLTVGPLNETYNHSSYQCMVTTFFGSDTSGVGTVTVVGM